MVSEQEYLTVREQILSIIEEADAPIDPAELLTRLREEGVSRGLGSAIMWEMIRAGYLRRSSDWRVARGPRPRQEVEMHA